jgi:hypothetical protein
VHIELALGGNIPLRGFIAQPVSTFATTHPSLAGEDDEKNPGKEDAYCAVFADPSECTQQAVKGVQMYWTEEELRHQLWMTMSALADLEFREAAAYKAHKKEQEKTADTFENFRKTMGTEVESIHKAQEDMHSQHTAAFTALVEQLMAAATGLHAYMNDGANSTRARIEADNATEVEDSQKVLRTLAEKINLVNRHVEDLHAEALAGVRATHAYAQAVEVAMRAGDARLNVSIASLAGDISAFDKDEHGDDCGLCCSVIEKGERGVASISDRASDDQQYAEWMMNHDALHHMANAVIIIIDAHA